MKPMNTPEIKKELTTLSWEVKDLLEQSKYLEAEVLIKDAMGNYIHAPEPHNLLGLLMEAQNDHLTAMKHFRAAYALDPTYLPSRHNLERFGSFYPKGKWAYDESDCPQEKMCDIYKYKVEYDERDIGHVVRKD